MAHRVGSAPQLTGLERDQCTPLLLRKQRVYLDQAAKDHFMELLGKYFPLPPVSLVRPLARSPQICRPLSGLISVIDTTYEE